MNWPLPPAEEQHSNVADSFGCVSFAAIHCIESQEIKQTGQTPGYSERALAKLSGAVYTGPQNKRGNNVNAVYNAIETYGLILDSDWPTELGDNWTLDDFYTDIPPEILAKAIRPTISLVNAVNFTLAPVWTALLIGGTMSHMVEMLDWVNYFDSYQQYQKQLNGSDQITWQGMLVLNPKDKRMLVFFQVKGNQTIWSLMDGSWVGFADMTAFNNYVNGRSYTTIELDQPEFAKLKSNSDVFKS
jgi:hypothetical protein